MKLAVRALLGLGLIAAFCAGLAAGRLAESTRNSESREGREIREGQHGYINPLLECEVAGQRLYSALRPFDSQLRERIESLERDQLFDSVAVYFRDLNNGIWLGYREEKRFIPASLAKMPVVIACYRLAEFEPGFLARRILFEGLPEERNPAFLNPESNLERGRTYSVDELIRRVAIFSDNASARLLRQALPPEFLERVYFDLGIDPERLEKQDFSYSPKEYGAFFRVLYNASYLSKQFSEQALQYFGQSTFDLGLVAGVSEGTVVSHKFGLWEEPSPGRPVPLQLHDCGIVYYPGRPYLLCVMTAGKTYENLTTAIAAISRFVYEQVDHAQRGLGGQGAPGPDPFLRSQRY